MRQNRQDQNHNNQDQAKEQQIKSQFMDQYDQRYEVFQPENNQHYTDDDKIYMSGKKKVKRNNSQRFIFKASLANTQKYKNERIYFKFAEPYQIQKRYMQFVLDSLDNGKNCLLQAPTGSGKTLCLLNSVFGWLVNQKSSNQRRVIYTSRSHSQLEQIKKQLQKTCYRPQTVIFGGRKKLCCNQKIKKKQDNQEEGNYNQCVKAVQFKRVWKKIQNMSQLQKIKKKITPQFEIQVQKNKCNYFADYKTRSEPYFAIYRGLNHGNQIISINDQYKKCHTNNICPYYYPSSVKNLPDLVVMPYTYVLNKNILGRNSKIIQDSIIIFDQGHNILQAARSGLTMTMTSKQIESIVKTLKTCIKKIQAGFDDFPNPNDQMSGSDDQLYQQQSKMQIKQQQNQSKLMIKIQQEQLQNNQIMVQQKAENENENTDNTDRKKNDKPKKILVIEQQNKQQKQKFRSMLSHGLIKAINNLIPQIIKFTEKFNKYQQQNIEASNFNQKNDKILIDRGLDDKKIVITLIEILFGEVLYEDNSFNIFQKYALKLTLIGKQLIEIQNRIYKLSDEKYNPMSLNKFGSKLVEFAQIISDPIQLFDYGLFFQWKKKQQNKKKQYYLEIKMYCFNPKKMFTILNNLKPMSMIITSGTLSPLDSWDVQTGLQFNIMPIANDHVIEPKQSLTVFVPEYNQKKKLILSTGNNGCLIPNNSKVAMQIIRVICSNLSGGVLVAVPSKKWIYQIEKIFHDYNIDKKPFYEKTENTKNMQAFQHQYKIAANQPNGAIIFAVMRGKFTEGIDFADNMCRAVVIVGYPTPSDQDPQIKGKKDYFDRCKKAGISDIDGQTWKQKQIMRAVNQAMGRAIRHSKDYGMIFLLDNRYKWKQYKKYLAGWTLINQNTVKNDFGIKRECLQFEKANKN